MPIRWPKFLRWNRRKRTTYPPDHPFWYAPIGAYLPTSSGIDVDETEAVKYLAVFACIGLISGDIGRLPLFLYQGKPDGSKKRVLEHGLSDLTAVAPNQDMTAMNWKELIATHLLLWGNHYGQKNRSGTGEIVEIYPLPNPAQVLPYRTNNGQLRYEWRSNGETFDMGRDQMLHVAGWGFNGLVGQSVIGVAREAIGLGMAADEFSSRFFSNSATPSMVVSMPPEAQFTDDEHAEKYLETIKKQVTGLGKSHTVMIARNGETVSQLTMPLKDAQFLESREFQKVEICGMYRVPPHKIAIHGANSNYNNLVQENLHYLDSCLLHWLTRIELAFNHQLLTPEERKKGLYFKFKTQSLLRGDHEARANYYQTMIDRGIMTRNEVRALEDINPLPDDERGDETILPLNFVFAKDADAVPDNGQGLPNQDETPEEDEQRLLGWAQQATREAKIAAEKRSITSRDRIIKRYRPLILQAAQTVINRENKRVKSLSDKPVDEWIDDFYQDFAGYIDQKMGPTLRSFTSSIADVAVADTGADIDQEEIQKWINDYVRVYVTRHVASSTGQIKALAAEEDATEKINTRMDEWHEKRAEKIATRETVQGSQGIFQAVVWMAGMATVFRTRGKSCPYCRSLDGTVIKRGENIVNDGDEIKPKGTDQPMTFRGSKSHPPIHAGCDCYLTTG